MKISQALAANIIARVIGGRTLDYSLSQTWTKLVDIDPHDKALTQELCYGTLRHLGSLRAIVRFLLTRPAPDTQLEALLWVAMYQLRHTTAPPPAIVSNAVDAATSLQVTS